MRFVNGFYQVADFGDNDRSIQTFTNGGVKNAIASLEPGFAGAKHRFVQMIFTISLNPFEEHGFPL